MPHFTLRISLAAAVSLGAVSTSFAQAAAQPPPAPATQSAPAAQDPAKAEAAELEKIAKSPAGPERTKALRDFVAKKPTEELASAAQFLLARALVDAGAPSAEIVDAVKIALKTMPANDEDLLQYRVELAYSSASLLVQRGERLADAREIVKSAIDALPDDPRAKPLRHTLELVTASASSAEGKRDEALAIMNRIVAEDPDDQNALVALGEEHQRAGRIDDAIDAWVRAETVFEGDQIDGARLRDVYTKKHGSLEGLDAKLEQARSASIKRVALDARRAEGVAPEWQLVDLAGKPVKLSDLKGQVVVMDFWATWCPPCRAELPGFQELAKENAAKGVTFVAVNVEGAPEKEIWEKRVRAYVDENKFTFTVVNDFEGQANSAYKIEYLPTVVVIDKTGAIRYRNDGFEPGVKKILQAQVDSLLN